MKQSICGHIYISVSLFLYLERVHECDDCDSYFLKRDRIVDMGAFPAALVCDALVIL